MSQDITISQNCSQLCTTRHRLGRNHKTMDLKRFKNRLNEFLSQDDGEWFEAFSKLEDIQQALEQYKNNLQDKILEKRLMYTLNYDTEANSYHIFKLASQDRYPELTCQQAALIENRVNKGRNHKETEIKTIIKDIFKEAADKLKSAVDKVALRTDWKPTEKAPKKEERREQREQRGERGERGEQRGRNERGGEGDRVRGQDRELPTLKINKVASVDTHFNIRLKVQSIKKIFSLGEGSKKRTLLEGGDETGRAIFVVDTLGFVKEGRVIEIRNAKVYHFHGERQIQQDIKNSTVQELPGVQIQVSDAYNFTQKRRRRREDYTDRSSKPEESARSDRRDRHESNRPIRTNREDRPIRTDRNDRQQYRKREHSDEEGTNSQRRPREEAARERPARVPRRKSSSSSMGSNSQPEELMPKREKREEGQLDRKREGQGGKKKPTKIKDLEPGDEDLNLVAEIIEIQDGSNLVDSNMLFCMIGDDTGIVWAELPKFHPDIKINVTLFLESVEAAVHQARHKLIIRLGGESSIQKTSMKMPGINLEVNMSEADWVEEEDEEDGSQQGDNRQPVREVPSIVQDF